MNPIQLFQLASRQAHWLAVRQDVVAGNVANVNTPGYKAMDVEPFEAVLASQNRRMAATDPAHFVEDPMRNAVVTVNEEEAPVVKPSGNSVSLADELIKTGEIRREFEMNVGLVKAFHQMMMMTVSK
jgi:flagellar basal-body rod protein FlgB